VSPAVVFLTEQQPGFAPGIGTLPSRFRGGVVVFRRNGFVYIMQFFCQRIVAMKRILDIIKSFL